MTLETQQQILSICHRVASQKEYQHTWQEYEQSWDALYAWMDTLPEEQWNLIDNHIWAFFDVHMQMMEIALTQK